MGTCASPPDTDQQGSQTPRRQRSGGAGRDYVITVVGEMPRDIAERVSAAHASAIRGAGAKDVPMPARGQSRKGR